MATYQELLDSFRSTAEKLTTDQIPKLYKALRDEGKAPMEARALLEHDIGDIFVKRTILKHLPDEAKDKSKQKGLEEWKKLQERLPETSESDAARVQQNSQKVTSNENTTNNGNHTQTTTVSRSGDNESDDITMSRDDYNKMLDQNKTYNDIAYKAQQDLKKAQTFIKSQNEDIELLKKRLASEDELDDDRRPKQLTMDTFFPAAKKVIEIAHSERCPAGCHTWRAAKSIKVPG